MLCGEDLPGFVVGGETENYSIDFDDSAVEENIQNLSNSDSSSGDSIISENLNNISISSPIFQIPKISNSTLTGRKKWKMSSETPFLFASTNKETPHSSSDSSMDFSADFVSFTKGDEPKQYKSDAVVLQNLNRQRREKTWLEESWNLIDQFEKNNKGRTSMIFNDDEMLEPELPEVIIEVRKIIADLLLSI